jgi:hypothetical protein
MPVAADQAAPELALTEEDQHSTVPEEVDVPRVCIDCGKE